MAEEKRAFGAEVGKILHIVAHSLYSDKEVFLRELISNASDACDRLRYAALTEPALTADDPEFRIRIEADAKARTLTLSDNGIGMSHDELVENLGTIARSGTSAFVGQLSGDAAKDVALIGQFGVGFYSAFMVADTVEVVSRKAGEEEAWRWSSDGHGEFTIAPAERGARGTTITLHLRKEDRAFLEPERLRGVVKTYSDHIAVPIALAGEDGEETVNAASALWTRPKKEISAEQYAEFYRHVGHTFDEPWLTIHAKAEGRIEYTLLLFVPSARPFDIFDPQREHRVKLYVRRVFIAEGHEGLVPPYLRFVKGIVDSEDLPLNISRESLQANPIVAKIRGAITKRVLEELRKKAEKDADSYAQFWRDFGPVLKEGIYEDGEQRERILGLARFPSTVAPDGLVSLADYVGRMRDGQEAIYYITGEDAKILARSPQLEGFAARGIEVLLLADPVDAFWVNTVNEFEGKPLRAANRGGADLDAIAPVESAEEGEEPAPAVEGAALGTLIALLKQNLGEAVKEVRASERLRDSAVCLVADDQALDPHLERLLLHNKQLEAASPRILEINPRHALIRTLAEQAKSKGATQGFADAAQLLFDQARIMEGEPPADVSAFARRLSAIMEKGLGA